MATLTYLILHIIEPINWPYDRIVFCFLLAFDSQLVFRWWVWRRSGH